MHQARNSVAPRQGKGRAGPNRKRPPFFTEGWELAQQETEATKAKEKAEDDYTKALKDTVIAPPKDEAKDAPAPARCQHWD